MIRQASKFSADKSSTPKDYPVMDRLVAAGRPVSSAAECWGLQLKLAHAQLAALAATSRETTTKILGELAGY